MNERGKEAGMWYDGGDEVEGGGCTPEWAGVRGQARAVKEEVVGRALGVR